MAKYIARRPFAALEPGNRLVQPGETLEIKSETTANEMQQKGLVWPAYKTKEDKEAMKVQKPKQEVRIEWDAGPMFFVMEGDKIIDRLPKSEAEKLRDKLNG